jgi:hypothetical protein
MTFWLDPPPTTEAQYSLPMTPPLFRMYDPVTDAIAGIWPVP